MFKMADTIPDLQSITLYKCIFNGFVDFTIVSTSRVFSTIGKKRLCIKCPKCEMTVSELWVL